MSDEKFNPDEAYRRHRDKVWNGPMPPASGIEAPSGDETRSGSVEDESPVTEGQTPVSISDARIAEIREIPEKLSDYGRNWAVGDDYSEGRARTCDNAADAINDLLAALDAARQELDEARAQTSQVAKVLAWEPPYQAGLHKRIEAIIHRAEVTEARALAAEAERDRAMKACEQLAKRFDVMSGEEWDTLTQGDKS